MRYIAAYLLAALGGNAAPDAAAVKAILDSVGVSTDDASLDKVIAELKGKTIEEVIADGSEKLASVPSGGGGGGGGAGKGSDSASAMRLFQTMKMKPKPKKRMPPPNSGKAGAGRGAGSGGGGGGGRGVKKQQSLVVKPDIGGDAYSSSSDGGHKASTPSVTADDWRFARTDAGKIYYINIKTQETSWTLPPGCEPTQR